MRFFLILIVTLSYTHATDCLKREFPNYFAELHPDDAKRLINESLGSILDRLEVPYVEKSQTQIQYRGFFKKIQGIVDIKAPGAKAYISGGMVRSLLGYIYKKMHGMMLDATYFTPGANPKKVIEEVLYDIIHGKRRTDSLLSEFDEDEVGGKRTKVTAGGETINLPNMGAKTKFKPKELIPLQALGIASDYDILIDFPDETSDTIKAQTIEAAKNFINSAQAHLELTNDQSELKRAIVPDADVNEYHKQMDKSVLEGGATLDWLAFPVSGGVMKLPDGHLNIMDNFVQGYLRYVANAEATDKQAMRGLRALLEIPFLGFDAESSSVMVTELNKIIASGLLSEGALEQLKKMTRNARFGGAHNRFAGGECMPDGEVTKRVQELAKKLGKATLLPEFVGSHHIQTVQNAPTFMAYADFIETYTDSGKLYHGTPDIMNFLSMIRNGLVISSSTQGRAVYGYGVYTTEDHSTAEDYAGSIGVVIPITVDKSAHIVDMGVEDPQKPRTEQQKLNRQHYENWLVKKGIAETSFGNSFNRYADEFGIDIIVNTHILIQNAKAIRLEKSLKSIIEADRALVRTKVKTGKGVTIGKVLRSFSPIEGYGKMFPPSEEDLRVVENLKQEFEKNFGQSLDSFLSNGVISDLERLPIDEIISLDKLIELKEKIKHARQLMEEGVSDKMSISNFNALLDFEKRHKEPFDDLKQLIHTGIVNKISGPIDVIEDLSVIMGQFDALKQLVQNGIIDKFSASSFPIYVVSDFPTNLTDIVGQLPALKRLIDEGIIEKPSMSDLKYIPGDLSIVMSQINNLMRLVNDGIVKKLRIFDLKDIPGDLSIVMSQFNNLMRLVNDGIIKKLRIFDLKDIPADLSVVMSQFNNLKSLVEAGIIDKLDTFDLKNIPADLSVVMSQFNLLKRLIDAKIVSHLSLYDLRYLPLSLTEEQIVLLELLAPVMEPATLSSLKSLPETLSEVMVQNIVILVNSDILKKIRYSDLKNLKLIDLHKAVAQVKLLKILIQEKIVSVLDERSINNFPDDLSMAVQKIDLLKALKTKWFWMDLHRLDSIPEFFNEEIADALQKLKKSFVYLSNMPLKDIPPFFNNDCRIQE